jgi:hypothetical protein
MKQWQQDGPPPTERVDATHQRCPGCGVVFKDADFVKHYLDSHVLTVSEEQDAVAIIVNDLVGKGLIKGSL